MESTHTALDSESFAELASQLSACAHAIEAFLVEELDAIESLRRGLAEGENAPARRDPGDDPVLAAVRAQFDRLRETTEKPAASA